MKQPCTGLLATLVAVLLVGCSQHPQATQAVLSAEDALVQVRDMAQKYAPEQLQAVEAQMNALRDLLVKCDFKAELAAAPALNAAISNLKGAAGIGVNDLDISPVPVGAINRSRLTLWAQSIVSDAHNV